MVLGSSTGWYNTEAMRFVVYGIVFFLGGLSALTFNSSLFPRKISLHPTRQVALTERAASVSAIKVSRVIDGDTIELIDGRRVRYIGIDTPEMADPRKNVGCFVKEAAEENKRLVEGKTVRLEKDISEMDKYGRLLWYVYIDDVFINDYLLRQGFARIDTIPPDVAHREQFLEAEREARGQGRGLWDKCVNVLNGM